MAPLRALERCVVFGSEQHLQGMLCEPAGAPPGSDVPVVLMWNVGPIHRVGPYRMNVELARQLADIGVPSLRFDLTGLGDSGTARSEHLTRDRAVADVREAMDYLAQRCGTTRFVLVGHCSSADNAHRAAVADKRVQGAVLIDGYSYVTWRCCMRRYGLFLLNPDRIRNLIVRTLHWVAGWFDRGGAAAAGEETAFAWQLPPHHEAAADLQALVDRGVELMYVFAGQYHRRYNYAHQFYDMYPGVAMRDRVVSHFMQDCDHTFSGVAGRRRLIGLIREWAADRFMG
ncbi:MAG: hypothetical protein HN919_14005 [Verrucomicrobia bacterium]|nr:hypothetical protein [Verrucomicrobiota bacterium]MBT7067412.1 hypothetical protein [Verrucomicrobiota bacterium]MBT7700066.1 hypothetical protein [Verrucomicrobiota bacterium]